MPVTIISNEKYESLKNHDLTAETDPRLVSLSEYNDGKYQFRQHYKLSDCSNINGTDISISWDAFHEKVNNYNPLPSGNEELKVLKFLHCFDVATNSLYLLLRISIRNPQPIPGLSEYLLNSTIQPVWYKITQDSIQSIAPPTDTEVNAVYSNNVYYTPTPDDCQALIPIANDGNARFIRNLCFPWLTEIFQMFKDNKEPANAKIHFSTYTPQITDANISNEEWPHGLVLYLTKSDGTILINDEDDSVIVPFYNKGANYATLCPPKCNRVIVL